MNHLNVEVLEAAAVSPLTLSCQEHLINRPEPNDVETRINQCAVTNCLIGKNNVFLLEIKISIHL